MMGKFGAACALMAMTLAIPCVHSFAQTTAPDQTSQQPSTTQQPSPTAQQPSTSAPQQTPAAQEPATEESIALGRRKRTKDYKNWTFNVGAGANMDGGTTKSFVRQGGFVASAGVARNANRYLGLRADFIFADLPLRDSALELAQAASATTHAYSFTLDPIINIPASKRYSGYILFGPAFIHRTGSLGNDTTVPGNPCTAFWRWWTGCQSASIPLSGDFVNVTENQLGYNVGAGVAAKFPSGAEFYLEYRFMHGSNSPVTTDFRPITVGFRW